MAWPSWVEGITLVSALSSTRLTVCLILCYNPVSMSLCSSAWQGGPWGWGCLGNFAFQGSTQAQALRWWEDAKQCWWTSYQVLGHMACAMLLHPHHSPPRELSSSTTDAEILCNWLTLLINGGARIQTQFWLQNLSLHVFFLSLSFFPVQWNVMVKSMNSRTRLLGFKSQPHRLQAAWLWACYSFSLSQFLLL